MNWLLILMMAVVTFAIRYTLFARANSIELPPKLEKALKFSAPCVLTAIWVPAILMPDGDLAIHLDNPYLLGGIIAIAVALWKKNILLTIVSSMVFFFGYKLFILG